MFWFYTDFYNMKRKYLPADKEIKALGVEEKQGSTAVEIGSRKRKQETAGYVVTVLSDTNFLYVQMSGVLSYVSE